MVVFWQAEAIFFSKKADSEYNRSKYINPFILSNHIHESLPMRTGITKPI